MDSQRWKRVRSIVEQIDLLPDDERRAFVASSCDGDRELAEEVARLIDVDPDESGFLRVEQHGVLKRIVEGHPADFADEHRPGQRVGAWRIERKIGSGG